MIWSTLSLVHEQYQPPLNNMNFKNSQMKPSTFANNTHNLINRNMNKTSHITQTHDLKESIHPIALTLS